MKAYVTLLSNESYLNGVLALSKSLKSCKSAYPLFCLISANLQLASYERIKARLDRADVKCIRLEKVAAPENINNDKDYSHWNYTFDKLYVWEQIQFEKIVYLDCDMVVVKNIDHIFQCDNITSVCAGNEYPGNEQWDGLNSGLMVLEPDKSVCNKLVGLVGELVKQNKDKSIGDQDVINYFYSEWKRSPSLHLNDGYNMLVHYLTYYVRHLNFSLANNNGKEIYILHFAGRVKPWMILWSVKNFLWFVYETIHNPLYFKAFLLFRRYARHNLP